MASRPVHLVAAESGNDRAAELRAGLQAAGHPVRLHALGPPGSSAEPSRLRDELALMEGGVRDALADEEGAVLLLADERGALAVAEMLRVLLDERGLGWEEAWARTTRVVHARFGCPKTEPGRPFWRVSFLEKERPRLLEILYEVNRRHLDEVEALWPGDGDKRKRLSLFREGEHKRLRPGPLVVLAAARADVATPWEGPAAEILQCLSVLRSRSLHARPTPVFAPRWVAEGNPPLAALLDRAVGDEWRRRPEALERLETLAFDPGFRDSFRAVRRANRERLCSYLSERLGLEASPEGLVDVRLGALLPRERPLLTVLGLVREHLRVAAGGWTPPAPRTVVIARVAEAAQGGDDRLMALERAVAHAVNDDARARAFLRVAVLPSCDPETECLLAAAADLSNQPGTAGSGAAGARALGLAVNGAVTLGTRDGTVRELEEAVGAEGLFLFGLGPLETHAWREGRVYRPQDVYAIDPLVRLSLDAVVSRRYAPRAGAFDWIRHELLDERDPWLVLADLGAYIHRQDEALAEFAHPHTFVEKAILTMGRARRFWIDRLEVTG
jgi:starch phosphorylase